MKEIFFKVAVALVVGSTCCAVGADIQTQVSEMRLKAKQTGKPAIVFLVAGQSNAEGTGVLSPQIHAALGRQNGTKGQKCRPLTPMSTASEIGLPIRAGDYTHSYIWVPEQGFSRVDPETNLRPASLNSKWHGMELPVIRELESRFPNHDIFVVKHALGGTSLHRHWNPTQSDGLYAKWLGYYRHAVAQLSREYPEVRVIGLYWDQGESDGIDGKHSEYAANLKNLIATVRKDTGLPKLPVFIRKHIFKGPNIDVIISAQKEIVEADPHCYLLDIDCGNRTVNYQTWAYSPGNGHISSKGFVELTKRLFDGPLRDATVESFDKVNRETVADWGPVVVRTGGLSVKSEYHVAVNGCDSNKGSESQPFKTISAAAQVAQPGDVVTVHAGTYRERINPPRGGTSESKRIVYQAAEGDPVIISGAEVVKNWSKTTNDTWKVTLPNSFFGSFNPYNDLIHGDWFSAKGRPHHTGAVYLDGHWLTEAAKMENVLQPVGKTPLWFGQVDESNTTIWAQFKDVCPNERLAEINVRQTVFYPDQPGRGYITVRGFTMEKAATPWAPPTAEQKGLIGTHWSKGWIIEDNTIRYSVCTGITLGKYGDEWDNKSATAGAYNHTIERALSNGWNKATVGSHVVRNNTVSHCEQAGIVGSLGAVFSTITGNTIRDIHVRRLFSGAEMAGIKIHAAIDVQIMNNHIYRASRGLWLDWMAQGPHVIGNLFRDNQGEDLFLEVNHGPILVANNIFLSSGTLLTSAQGCAFAHNLIAGTFKRQNRFDGRQTPFHKPHSTEVAGLHNNPNGDDRYYNNIFIQRGDLTPYDDAALLPVTMEGNVFLKGAKPSKHETKPLVKPDVDPALKLVEKEDGFYLSVNLDRAWGTEQPRKLVTTDLLGKAQIPNVSFENADGSDIKINTDYFGAKRNPANPFPGPFECSGNKGEIKVWPRD